MSSSAIILTSKISSTFVVVAQMFSRVINCAGHCDLHLETPLINLHLRTLICQTHTKLGIFTLFLLRDPSLFYQLVKSSSHTLLKMLCLLLKDHPK